MISLNFILAFASLCVYFFRLLYGTFASLHSPSFRKEKWKSLLCCLYTTTMTRCRLSSPQFLLFIFFCVCGGEKGIVVQWTGLPGMNGYFSLRILILVTHNVEWKQNKTKLVFMFYFFFSSSHSPCRLNIVDDNDEKRGRKFPYLHFCVM